MDRLLGSLRSLRPWQVSVLIVALVGAGVATFAVYLSVTSTDSVELTEDQQIVPVQRGDLVNQISISGTLSLPSREVLRFGSEGVVDEVLIEEGQRVAEGDVLARLDEDTIASLDKGVVQARVDLRDAQDALEDYLEPISALELARAEQQVANAELALRLATESLEDLVNPADLLVTEANAKVASARLALENAQEAFDELLEPPTDLERAQAQAKVASARLALENAQEAFDELLEPPTDLERAQAQAKVASARLALENAQEAFDELLEPPTDLEQAQAQAKVANAQTMLQTAEDALEALLEPATDHRVAEVKANIAAREVAAKNARDALEDFWAGVSDDDLADARLAVETAMTVLANSQSDLAIAERSWNTKTSAAADTLADSADAYSEMFMKWLGVRMDRKSLDSDYEAALSGLGIDLRSIFDPSISAPDLRAGEAPIPPDDVSTPWNERTIFTWINLSPIPITATCDPGDLPPLGVCVEEEFRTAADSYQAEMDNWDSLQAEQANALTGAESAVRTAQNALDRARETLEDLEESPDLVVGEDLEAKFNLATAELERAWDDYEDMLEPADAVALSDQRARVDLATAELERAWDDFEDMLEPADALVLSDQRARVDLATVDLDAAKDDLAELGELAHPAELADQRAQIALAQQNLKEAVEDLESLDEPADETTTVANQRHQVALAQMDVEKAESDLGDLLAGMEQTEYRTKLQAIEGARLDLEERKQDLRDLLTNDQDPLDRVLLEANIASARVALGQAEQHLDDATMTAPWDGFVSQVNVEAGEEVKPSTNIMVVVDTSVVEIDGSVDEIDVLSIELGAEAVVTVDALPGQTIEGEVSFLASEPADSQSGQGVVGYPVRVRLDLPPGLQTPQGLSAVASIVISQELDALLLPITAIHGSFTEPTVILMVDGQVVETPVVLGSSDDFWTVITSGLSEGDMIVMMVPGDFEFGSFGGPGGGRRVRREVTVGR